MNSRIPAGPLRTTKEVTHHVRDKRTNAALRSRGCLIAYSGILSTHDHAIELGDADVHARPLSTSADASGPATPSSRQPRDRDVRKMKNSVGSNATASKLLPGAVRSSHHSTEDRIGLHHCYAHCCQNCDGFRTHLHTATRSIPSSEFQLSC